jgi:hypothetical protein
MAYDPKSYELRESSIEGEYYCGDLPGTLQLRKDPAELKKLEIDHLKEDVKNWTVEENDEVYFKQLLRLNKKIEDHELLCVTKSVSGNGMIWLKGAIYNKKSKLIYLMTATTDRSKVDRPLDSHDPMYVIGHYRMCAPKLFWSTLKTACADL